MFRVLRYDTQESTGKGETSATGEMKGDRQIN